MTFMKLIWSRMTQPTLIFAVAGPKSSLLWCWSGLGQKLYFQQEDKLPSSILELLGWLFG